MGVIYKYPIAEFTEYLVSPGLHSLAPHTQKEISSEAILLTMNWHRP